MTAIRRHTKSIAALVAALVAITALSLTLTANKADAATYYASGSVGYVSYQRGVCKYYPVWNRLDSSYGIPAIYAPNWRAGGGNDSAWVRYRIFNFNDASQVTHSSNWSGWAVAYDNQAAAFSGSGALFQNVPNNSSIHVVVEWWSSTQRLGIVVHRVDQYNHYSGNLSPSGPIGGCTKW